MPDLSPRGRVIRDAIIYTPIFALCSVILLLMIVGVFDRAPLGMALLAIVTFLFGYQSVQSLRDLAARPQEVNGAVARRWTKRDGFVVKSHYITVGKAIYRIPVEVYLDLKVQDTVKVVAYPYTGMVVSVERTGRPVAEEPPPGPQPSKGRMRTLRTARATPTSRERRQAGERDAGARGEGGGPP